MGVSQVRLTTFPRQSFAWRRILLYFTKLVVRTEVRPCLSKKLGASEGEYTSSLSKNSMHLTSIFSTTFMGRFKPKKIALELFAGYFRAILGMVAFVDIYTIPL